MVATTGHLTLKDIAELAQVSRPAVSNWRARYSDFPQPVEESTPRKPLFESAAVVDWLKHNGFFPEDAENELRLTALWAVANLLRNELDVDDIPLVMLTLLALDKDANFSVSSEYEELKASISGETLKEVQQGIASLKLEDYGKVAQLVVDRFLGIGSRGARSQYGTSTSLSSATVVAAASTTLDDVGTILDPACGIAATLVGVGRQVPEAQLIGVELEPHIASLAQLLVYLTGYEANIEVGDSLGGDPFFDRKVDLIVCEPPLGMRATRSAGDALRGASPNASLEDLFLLYASSHLGTGARAYVMASEYTTFGTRFKDQRQRLVADGRVEAIVGLPVGLFSSSRLPAALWVLSSEPVKEPLLIDASTARPKSVPGRIAEWLTAARNGEATDVPYKTVSLADVVTHDGSLHPATHLKEPLDSAEMAPVFDAALESLRAGVKGVARVNLPSTTSAAITPAESSTALGDLVRAGHFEWFAGRYRADEDLIDEEHAGEESGSGVARIVSLRRDSKPAFVGEFEAKHVLHSGDIVVPRISKQEAWVFKEDGHTWVPSGHVAVLRPVSGEYDSDFIAACLNAPVNIDTRGMVPRRVPLLRAVIADLNPEQRAIAAELSRSLAEARESARELEREALETSDAFLNLIFAN